MRRVFFLFGLALWLAACAVATPTATLAPTQVQAIAATATATAITAPTATTEPAATPQAQETAWWDDIVFYEIFVRSFYDSDGDGIGDFKGIIAKLDYLAALGIKGIWLMPIQPAASYHGYDVTDYMAVNPDYGTMDDFRQLLDEARRRGIRVIIDFVMNHTSDKHPWFIASQDPQSDKRDWYIWSDTKPNMAGPSGEVVWHQGQTGWYYGAFWSGMPDLNYRTPAVTQQMEAVAGFWLQDVGVDGFRIDAVRYLIESGKDTVNTAETHEWFKQFHGFYKGIRPQAMVIGEVWDSVFAAAPYVRNGEMDLVFNFELASAFMSGVNGRSGKKISDAMSFNLGRFPPGQFGSFLTNHDMNRAMSQFGGDAGKMRSAAVLYLTAPGVPFIYYGEEIGMTGSKPDEYIRTPMQWSGALNAGFTTGTPWITMTADYQRANVAVQDADPNSLLSLYRRLVALRNQHAALRSGDTLKIDTGNSAVFATLRAGAGEAILIVLNLGDTSIADYSLNLPDGPLQGRYAMEPLLGEGTFAPLSANDKGGFSGYQPLPELQPGTRLVLTLRRF